MSDPTPLHLLPVIASSDASLAAGLNNPPAESEGQNEGSFLEFLNAFNALPGANNSAVESALEGGSMLPLAVQTAEAGRKALLTMPVAQSQAVTTEAGIPSGNPAMAAQLAATHSIALHDAELNGTALNSPLAGVAEEGLVAEQDLSSRVSSAALASRLVSLAQANSGHLPGNHVSAAASTSSSPLIASSESTLPPIASADGLITPLTPQQVANQPQLAAMTGLANKDSLAKSALAAVPRVGVVSALETTGDAKASSLPSVELTMSEADTFFAAQVKKMVAEQMTGMNPERPLVQNTMASMTANVANNQHISTAQLGIQNPGAASLLTTETVSTTGHQATISETFGRPEWNQGMSKQVLWMANQNIRSAELRLNPAHLGPIEVHIDMEDDKVNLAFTSRHAAVREAVEQALPRLREMFEESGLNLADTDVSQQSFAEQRSQQSANHSDHQNEGFANRSDASAVNTTGASDSENIHNIDMGLVDYYI